MKISSATTPLVRLFRSALEKATHGGDSLTLIIEEIQECGFAGSRARVTVLASLAQWLAIE